MNERAWAMILKPGTDRTQECLDKDKIVNGWGVDAPPEDYYHLREAIRLAYYPEATDNLAAGQAAGMVYTFCTQIKKGDFVLIPDFDYKFYIGKIVSEKYACDQDGFYEHDVLWLHGKQALSWKTAPAALSRACRSRRSFKNCDYALEDIKAIAADKSYLMKGWEEELYETIVDTVSHYMLKGRIDPSTFQTQVLPKILRAAGASEMLNRAGAADKGIDIKVTFPIAGNLAYKQIGVQTKYWQPSPPVGKEVIDDTISGAKAESLDTAWVITTGTFTAEVQEYAIQRTDNTGVEIVLIDGRALSQLVLEYLDKAFLTS